MLTQTLFGVNIFTCVVGKHEEHCSISNKEDYRAMGTKEQRQSIYEKDVLEEVEKGVGFNKIMEMIEHPMIPENQREHLKNFAARHCL